MPHTSSDVNGPFLAGDEEPVLVWAVREDILLANDAALSLLADVHAEPETAATRTTLARTLEKIVSDDGPHRRAWSVGRPQRGARATADPSPTLLDPSPPSRQDRRAIEPDQGVASTLHALAHCVRAWVRRIVAAS